MFSDLAMAYLFLGGTGAGSALVCSAIGVFGEATSLQQAIATRFTYTEGKAWSRFLGAGNLCAFLCLTIGAICLFTDLGQPCRIMFLFFPPKASYLAFGAWCIAISLAMTAFLALVWYGAIRIGVVALKVLNALSAIFAVMVMIYTGVMLSNIAAVPAWNTAWIVILFFLSSASCGIALFVISSMISGAMRYFPNTFTILVKIDCATIFLEIIVLAVFALSIYIPFGNAASFVGPTAHAAVASANNLFFGQFAYWFWIGVAGVGLIIPLCTEIAFLNMRGSVNCGSVALSQYALFSISAASVLLGGIMLRFLIVLSGTHPVLTHLL